MSLIREAVTQMVNLINALRENKITRIEACVKNGKLTVSLNHEMETSHAKPQPASAAPPKQTRQHKADGRGNPWGRKGAPTSLADAQRRIARIAGRPHPERFAKTVSKLKAWIADRRVQPSNVVKGEFKPAATPPTAVAPKVNKNVVDNVREQLRKAASSKK